MCGEDVRPIRVVWSNRDGERGVWGLAQVPGPRRRAWIGRAPRPEGVRARPHVPRIVGSIVTVQAQSMGTRGEVGWWGCEDWKIRRKMGGGEANEVKEEREGQVPPPPPTPPPPSPTARPPKRGKGGKATNGPTGKKRKQFEWDSDAESDDPACSFSSSFDEDSLPQKKNPPRGHRGELHKVLALPPMGPWGAHRSCVGRRHRTSQGPKYGTRFARGAPFGGVGCVLCHGRLAAVQLATPAAIRRGPSSPKPRHVGVVCWPSCWPPRCTRWGCDMTAPRAKGRRPSRTSQCTRGVWLAGGVTVASPTMGPGASCSNHMVSASGGCRTTAPFRR